MPNEVIGQVHHLAITAENSEGKVFTDILSDQFTDDTDEESKTESGIFNNQQPRETVAIEEEARNDTECMTNYNTVMPPENDDTGDTEDQIEDHIPDNTENGNNTEEEIIEHEEEESE